MEKLRGKNHPNWKGGTTVNEYLRYILKEHLQFFLESYNFTCFVSNQYGGDLELHHVINFSTIRDNIFKELNFPLYENIKQYSNEELEKIKDAFLKEHSKEVMIPLSKSIHILFHKIYGRRNNNLEQLIEFKNKFNNGELI